MIATAWNNGEHHESGAGYGLKIDPADRDHYFSTGWQNVVIEFPDGRDVTVNVDKDSFWDARCRELISQEIGRWLRSQGLAPWLAGKPPKLSLEPVTGNRFAISRGQTLEQHLKTKAFVERADRFCADVSSAVRGTGIVVERTDGTWPERGSCIGLAQGNAFAQFVCKAPDDMQANAAFVQDLWAIAVRTNLDTTEHLFLCAGDGWRLTKARADYRGQTEGIAQLFEFIRPLLVQAGLPVKVSEAIKVARA